MNKKELLDTPEIKPTNDMIKALAERVQGWRNESVAKYKMAIRVKKITGEQIYKIAVFKGPDSPAAYIFLDVPNKRYYTWDIYAKKWRTLMIHNMIPWSYKYADYTYAPKTTYGILKGALGTDGESAAEVVAAWQQGIKDAKREKAKQAERDRVNAEMAYVKNEPKDFESWANKQGEQFIFYNYSRKIEKGWCTYCKKEVPVSEPRHLKEGRCIKCGQKIRFICNSRRKVMWSKWIYADLIQEFKDGIISRGYSIRKKLEYGSNTILTSEMDRETLTADGIRKEYGWNQGEWKRRATNERDYTRYSWYYSRIFYCDHINHGIASLKSSYLLTDKTISPMLYVINEKRHPVIEKCAKAGLPRLASEFITNHSATYVIDGMEDGELAKNLGIDNMRLKRLREIQKGGGTWAMLEWYQAEKAADTIWDDEMIIHFVLWSIEPRDMEDMLRYIPFKKAHNYIVKQCRICTESASQVVQTWEDYMSMAKRLRMDLTKQLVYMPKNLDKAHSECVDLLNTKKIGEESKKLKKKWPKVEKNLKGLDRYEWSDKEYCIIAPRSIEDIYREGMLLRHCIHTCDIYWERITNKTTFLMFLRRTESPDTPWYTLEVEPGGNIRQKRTVGDNQNEDLKAALPFLKKWQKHIQKIMSDEDKKLAEASDKQRKENYKQIRKEQKKVWHGKLQGKLLADVLEADFMAAV